jgi:hypothetical protein
MVSHLSSKSSELDALNCIRHRSEEKGETVERKSEGVFNSITFLSFGSQLRTRYVKRILAQ